MARVRNSIATCCIRKAGSGFGLQIFVYADFVIQETLAYKHSGRSMNSVSYVLVMY
jgi:hypothetical protein